MPKIRVFLVDDHTVLRTGLRMLLDAQTDVEVVGEAGEGQSALKGVEEKRPDVVVMDLGMPVLDGTDATHSILAKCPKTKILVLTMHDDVSYFRRMLEMGVTGYVLKHAADTELLAAIRAVHRGEMYVDPLLTRVLVDDALDKSSSPRTERDAISDLSAREREVFDRVVLGYTNQQISDQLGVSVKTVETYKARVMDKLGVRKRAELVRYALQRGLLKEKK